MSPEAVRALLDLGTPGLLLVGLWGMVSGFVVSGKSHREVMKERDDCLARERDLNKDVREISRAALAALEKAALSEKK